MSEEDENETDHQLEIDKNENCTPSNFTTENLRLHNRAQDFQANNSINNTSSSSHVAPLATNQSLNVDLEAAKTGNPITNQKEQAKTSWYSPRRLWSNFSKTTIKESLETITLSGLTTFLGWYWGGSLNYSYPPLINSIAMITGSNNADQVETQDIIRKLIKLGCPMIAMYIMNYYAFDNLNPYPGNQFFFALSMAMMQELKMLAGRSAKTAKGLYKFIQDKLPKDPTQAAHVKRAIEAGELAALGASATAVGIATEAVQESINGSYTSLSTLYAGIAAGNVADMIKNRPYWLRTIALLPAATIAEVINYFGLQNTRPEVAEMFFFAWLATTIDEIKKKLGKKIESNNRSTSTTTGGNLISSPGTAAKIA